VSPPSGSLARIARTSRWLDRTYALHLALDPRPFILDAEQVQRCLPPGSPRTGVACQQRGSELAIAIYVDPRDADDPGTLLEETSHLLCLAWHASLNRPVSALALELQAEVDRFLHARVHGGDPFDHFHHFTWAEWLDDADVDVRDRYATAHRAGLRYCRRLQGRYPRPADLPGLVAELRAFYRASPQAKLRAAH